MMVAEPILAIASLGAQGIVVGCAISGVLGRFRGSGHVDVAMEKK